MNRLVSIGIAIALAPAIVLAIGKFFAAPDDIEIYEIVLFDFGLPLGAMLVAAGLLLAAGAKVRKTPAVTRSGQIFLKYGLRLWDRLMKSPNAHIIWLVIASVLFGVGLFVPFESDARMSSIGLMKLLFGWLFLGDTLVWLAFPLTLIAWASIGLRNARAAVTFSALALLNALPFLAGPKIQYGWGDTMRSLAQTPEIGYFLLLAAIGATLIASIKLKSSMQKSKKETGANLELRDDAWRDRKN